MKTSIKDIIKFSYKTDKVLFTSLILEQIVSSADIFINLYLVKLIINAFVKGKTKEEILFLCLIALISNSKHSWCENHRHQRAHDRRRRK